MEKENETNYLNNTSNSRELVGSYITLSPSSYHNSNEIKESNEKQTQKKQSK